MINVKMNIEEYDKEQEDLLMAAELLQSMGNAEGMSTSEFYASLLFSDIEESKHQQVFLAAIALETMLANADEHGSFDTTH